MNDPTNADIEDLLMRIIRDGFNRSLGSLEAAGVLDTKKMRRHYSGVGSKYYDMVTEQMALTARYTAPSVRLLFRDDGGASEGEKAGV